MNIFKEMETSNIENEGNKGRFVLIRYEDYFCEFFNHQGIFKKTSSSISARNPLKKDEDQIEYELSSDEEEMLENAESLLSDDPEDEDDQFGDEEDDFVVPDGYLSDKEYDDLELDEGEKSKSKNQNLTPF